MWTSLRTFIGAGFPRFAHPGFGSRLLGSNCFTLRGCTSRAFCLGGLRVLPLPSTLGLCRRRCARQGAGRQHILVRPTLDPLQISTQPEPVQAAADELRRGLAIRQVVRADVLVDHVQEPAGHVRLIGMPVGLALGEHVPDHDQQLAGDGDDGLVAPHPRLQPGQVGDPEIMRARRHLGRADHHVAQVAPSGLGDLATALGQPLTVTLPNGVTSRYSYDNASRLAVLSHTTLTQTLAAYMYTVDAVGNRTQVLESTLITVTNGSSISHGSIASAALATNGSRGSVTAFTGGAAILAFTHIRQTPSYILSPVAIHYAYHPLYRLTAANYSIGGVYTNTYDAVGNRLAEGAPAPFDFARCKLYELLLPSSPILPRSLTQP